jgi:hypothetical protein
VVPMTLYSILAWDLTAVPLLAKGSRNRSSVFAEALSDGDAIAIVEAVMGKAKKGDMVAARLVLDRLWPAPKGRAVAFDLPAATDANGIMEAHAALLRGLAKGVLTPDEAESVSRMLSAHLRVVENVELEARMNEPFKFTLKIGQVSADGSRTVADHPRQKEAMFSPNTAKGCR